MRRSWITPALAGSTLRRLGGFPKTRDHPRVGGEHLASLSGWLKLRGSPPRWRGALRVSSGAKGVYGITPALAGSTHEGQFNTNVRRDHPRVGGEHATISARHASGIGSPPRWRGARIAWWLAASFDGITPALAGSTPDWRDRTRSEGDHPRVGGEHASLFDHRLILPGSPPRWRGAHVMPKIDRYGVRITPALAGSTTDTDFRVIA